MFSKSKLIWLFVSLFFINTHAFAGGSGPMYAPERGGVTLKLVNHSDYTLTVPDLKSKRSGVLKTTSFTVNPGATYQYPSASTIEYVGGAEGQRGYFKLLIYDNGEYIFTLTPEIRSASHTTKIAPFMKADMNKRLPTTPEFKAVTSWKENSYFQVDFSVRQINISADPYKR